MDLDLGSTVRGYESDKDTFLQSKSVTSSQKEKHNQLNQTKIAYEERLLNELEDMDDPLDLFLDYMIWISTNYIDLDSTSGQEILRSTMERCLVYIQDLETYRNDPRFLKVWIWYINLFLSNNLHECDNTFTYMFRKGIGIKLSLFYEEFSKLLENAQYFLEAKILLELGAENNCRPYNRLLKSLNNCEERLRGMDIKENQENLSDSRERLKERINCGQVPFFIRRFLTSSLIADDKENRADFQLNSKIEVQKCAPNVYQDSILVADFKEETEKSNYHEIASGRYFASQLLKNENTKTPIYADQKQSSDPVYKLISNPGKKPEKVVFNFDLMLSLIHI